MSRTEVHTSTRLYRTLTLGKVAAATLLLFVFSLVAVAQTNRGGISGTVFDSSHSVIAGASITITNLGTNQKFHATTSATGSYTVLALEPVEYSVVVSAPGFKNATAERVKVDTAAVASVDITLQPGQVSSEVTVQATTVAINTESGTTSSTVSERQLTDIPLVNRSVLDLAVTQPNVMGDVGTENPGLSASATVPGYNLSINGGRPGNSVFLSDGANNTGVSLARTMVSFSPETVQEFTVQTSTYSAEYGNVAGGVINTTTKSGTNKLNGTVLWNNRNPYFAAPDYLGMAQGVSNAKQNKPQLKNNEGAFTAGGPVYIPKVYDGRNKTFWFVGVEPRWRRDKLTNCSNCYAILPTDAMRQGDFSGTNIYWSTAGKAQGSRVRVPDAIAAQFNLQKTGDNANIYQHYAYSTVDPTQLVALPSVQQFQNNVIPQTLLNASALKALKYIHPYGGDSSWFLNPDGNIQNFANPRTLQQDETRYTVRIDHNFNEKNLLNGRFTTTPITKQQFQPSSVTSMSTDHNQGKQIMLAYTHLFTPSIYNDLRLNYTRGTYSTSIAPQWDLRSGSNMNAELGLPIPGNANGGGLPSLPWIGGQGSTMVDDTEERYGITDILYMTKGNMTWKFGVDLGYALQNATPLYGSVGGIYDIRALQTGDSFSSNAKGGDQFASFLLGTPNAETFRPAVVSYYYRWKSLAGFVQNDWKVRPNLTLNLGLRYNLNYPRTEKYDHQGAFLADQDVTVPVPNGGINLTGYGWVDLPTITVPTYKFAGGPNSRYLWPVDYKNFEPRFGFSWAPSVLSSMHIVVKGGYAISHVAPTGISRVPQPDYTGTTSYNTGVNTSYAMQLGVNDAPLPSVTADQYIWGSVPKSRIVSYDPANLAANSAVMSGFVVAPHMKTPYSQNWNFGLAWQPTSSMSVELSYVGNKGTHLYSDWEMVNSKSSDWISLLASKQINLDKASILDPLGRVNGAGVALSITPSSLVGRYQGMSWGPYMLMDSNGSSIRHAAYVNFVWRSKRGLNLTSNYTFGKTMDDGTGPNDKFVLTGGQNAGEASFGAPRSYDRSVSSYDQKHVFNTSVIYDLPLGRNKSFLNNLPRPVDYMVGGWTISGISRVLSGLPAWTTLVDNNQVGDSSRTHTIRPDIVPGVSLKNPLYDSHCKTGAGCQPYLNPLAFQRPAIGSYGNAPRNLDSVRGPWMRFFDMSVQKNFRLGESGKRRLQFRADLLNAFNHPVFRMGPNNTFTDFSSAPTSAVLGSICLLAAGSCGANNATPNYTPSISYTDYNNWANAQAVNPGTVDQQKTVVKGTDGKSTTYYYYTGAGAATYKQINDMVNAQRVNNILPNNFFSVSLPAGFNTKNATEYDIRTLDGYKNYRLRNAYNTSFGTMYNPAGSSRYIQFGLKLFF